MATTAIPISLSPIATSRTQARCGWRATGGNRPASPLALPAAPAQCRSRNGARSCSRSGSDPGRNGVPWSRRSWRYREPPAKECRRSVRTRGRERATTRPSADRRVASAPGNNAASTRASSQPSGRGQVRPAASARFRYLHTVLTPIAQLRPICWYPRCSSNRRRMTSRSFRMGGPH